MDQQLSECVNAKFIGLRVIRGHKWTLDHQGSPLMGTIIGYRSDRNQDKRYIDVRWDDGKKEILEHPGTNTLCVLNNDTSAVWHRESCTICKDKIKGFLWKCVECYATNLCHNCYHGKKHDLCHNFKRFDWPGHYGTSVGKREHAKTIRTEGICEKAVVEPGKDLCGHVKHLRGEVKAVVSGGSTDYRWAVVVEWSSQKSSTYQLGLQGRVELICKKTAPGMKLYVDHLPAPWELDGMATYELVSLQPPGLKKYTPYGQVLGRNPYIMSPEDRVGETNSGRQPPQMKEDGSTVNDNVSAYEDVVVKPIATHPNNIIREDSHTDEDDYPTQNEARLEEVYEEDEAVPEEQDEGQEIYSEPDPITPNIAKVQKAYTPKHEVEELKIEAGDTILSVKHISGGWMSGYLRGNRGVFPEDCVNVVYVGEQKVSEMLSRERKISSASDRERRISPALDRLGVFTNQLNMNKEDHGVTSGIHDILHTKMRPNPTPEQQTTVTEFPQSTFKPSAPPAKISKPVAPAYQNWPEVTSEEQQNIKPQPWLKQTVEQITTSDGSILEDSLDQSSESKSCLPVNHHQPNVNKCPPVTMKDNGMTSGIQDILKAKMRLKPTPKPKPSPAKQQTTTEFPQSTSNPPAPHVKISKPVTPSYQNWPEEKYKFSQCVQIPTETNTSLAAIKGTSVTSELSTVILKPTPKPRSKPRPCKEQIMSSAGTTPDQNPEPKSCLPVNAYQPGEKYEFPQSAQMPREIDTASVQIKETSVVSELYTLNLKSKPKPPPTKPKPRVEQMTKSTGTNLNRSSEPKPCLHVNAYQPEDKTGDGPINMVPGMTSSVNSAGQERPIPKPRKTIKTP